MTTATVTAAAAPRRAPQRIILDNLERARRDPKHALAYLLSARAALTDAINLQTTMDEINRRLDAAAVCFEVTP
jgi:hypothetical protein